MTQRERQILEWIRQDPMISQQELAEKAGITPVSYTHLDVYKRQDTPRVLVPLCSTALVVGPYAK